MVKKTEWYFNSTDQKNKLHTIIWEPEVDVKMVLQISHGMCEYVDRYDEFARYLANQGILVVGNDHLGHGKTAKTKEDLGYFHESDGSRIVVDDLHSITEEMKKRYPNVPYILFGHSMGSFLARRYLMTYGKELDGAIIMGTGSQPKALLHVGYGVLGIIKKLHGPRYRSNLFNWLSFGSYNKKIKDKRTDKDWLSVNEKNVDAYLQDDFCNFNFTQNGYKTLFDTISFIQDEKNIGKIPKDLPIFLLAGEEDPVGVYGKSVRQVYRKYMETGVTNISIRLYPNIRHEILLEDNRKEIFEDIYNWLEGFMETK